MPVPTCRCCVALTGSSPFHDGIDTGYASFRLGLARRCGRRAARRRPCARPQRLSGHRRGSCIARRPRRRAEHAAVGAPPVRRATPPSSSASPTCAPTSTTCCCSPPSSARCPARSAARVAAGRRRRARVRRGAASARWRAARLRAGRTSCGAPAERQLVDGRGRGRRPARRAARRSRGSTASTTLVAELPRAPARPRPVRRAAARAFAATRRPAAVIRDAVAHSRRCRVTSARRQPRPEQRHRGRAASAALDVDALVGGSASDPRAARCRRRAPAHRPFGQQERRRAPALRIRPTPVAPTPAAIASRSTGDRRMVGAAWRRAAG